MIIDTDSLTDIAQGTMTYNWQDRSGHDRWTIRETGNNVHVGSQFDTGYSNPYESLAFRAVIRNWHAGNTMAVVEQKNSARAPKSYYSGAHATFGPSPLFGQQIIPQGIILYTHYHESDALTTAEQLPDRAIDLAETVWTVPKGPANLNRQMEEVFSLAAGEHFEDGMHTKFSHELGRFIRSQGLAAISSLRNAIERNVFRETYLAEALLWIGELDDNGTDDARRLLLEDACDSDSVSIRDAAVSGLSYLGAAKSKQRLEEMIRVERVKGVRANIEAVLAYLRN